MEALSVTAFGRGESEGGTAFVAAGQITHGVESSARRSPPAKLRPGGEQSRSARGQPGGYGGGQYSNGGEERAEKRDTLY